MADPAPGSFTHQDLARRLGVSVTTVKSYRRKFPEFFKTLGRTKPLRFDPEVLALCTDIRDGFQEGLDIPGLAERLAVQYTKNTYGTRQVRKQPVSAQTTDIQDLQRITQAVTQMAKGMGAMATAQARFDLLLGKTAGLLEGLHQRQSQLEQTLNGLLERIEQAAGPFAQPSGRLDQASTAPPPSSSTPSTPSPSGARVITVQGSDGRTDTYRFPGREPRPLEPTASPPTDMEPGPDAPEFTAQEAVPGSQDQPGHPGGQASPDTGFPDLTPDDLHLPVVIRSPRGEYLGLTGPGGTAFHLQQLLGFLGQRAELGPVRPDSWAGSGHDWDLTLQRPGARTGVHTFHFVKTQTPRGNQVVLLQGLSIDGSPASDTFLQAFFRQIKESLTI